MGRVENEADFPENFEALESEIISIVSIISGVTKVLDGVLTMLEDINGGGVGNLQNICAFATGAKGMIEYAGMQIDFAKDMLRNAEVTINAGVENVQRHIANGKEDA
ncbi:hypothetical protein [Magnetospirillum molischianum]|uniref:Uncharacterized protein n=1 Tax=Magnetospirillum molischianum DSM 120 TaxID=1150626 RepID=H8FYE4_MAGML|nr:hypothetical protein [Magnetospirillum molischianum]CCG43382.1 hypothetical protein PHAMO_80173 [Magnetospirillum molischianum DSM 120]